MAELMRVLEIHRRDAADAFDVDVGRQDLFAESQRGQDGELGAGVETVDVGARVGFGIAERCASASTVSSESPRFSISVRMKLLVPFRMPESDATRSPEMPSRSTAWMGMPPATLASMARLIPARMARSQISGPPSRHQFLVCRDDRFFLRDGGVDDFEPPPRSRRPVRRRYPHRDARPLPASPPS